MVISNYIFLVCSQSRSIAVVDVDEDGIAMNDLAVGISKWLTCWVEAMVIVDTELALCQTSTVSNDVSRRHQVATLQPHRGGQRSACTYVCGTANGVLNA